MDSEQFFGNLPQLVSGEKTYERPKRARAAGSGRFDRIPAGRTKCLKEVLHKLSAPAAQGGTAKIDERNSLIS